MQSACTKLLLISSTCRPLHPSLHNLKPFNASIPNTFKLKTLKMSRLTPQSLKTSLTHSSVPLPKPLHPPFRRGCICAYVRANECTAAQLNVQSHSLQPESPQGLQQRASDIAIPVMEHSHCQARSSSLACLGHVHSVGCSILCSGDCGSKQTDRQTDR